MKGLQRSKKTNLRIFLLIPLFVLLARCSGSSVAVQTGGPFPFPTDDFQIIDLVYQEDLSSESAHQAELAINVIPNADSPVQVLIVQGRTHTKVLCKELQGLTLTSAQIQSLKALTTGIQFNNFKRDYDGCSRHGLEHRIFFKESSGFELVAPQCYAFYPFEYSLIGLDICPFLAALKTDVAYTPPTQECVDVYNQLFTANGC